jgi:hypothetical protein
MRTAPSRAREIRQSRQISQVLPFNENGALAKHIGAAPNPSFELDGQGEIRTHDTVTGIPVFETGAFSLSATCPSPPEKQGL